jgi:hypothetical protein
VTADDFLRSKLRFNLPVSSQSEYTQFIETIFATKPRMLLAEFLKTFFEPSTKQESSLTLEELEAELKSKLKTNFRSVRKAFL